MALPAGRYGVTKNQLLKIKKLPMNTIKLLEELTEKFDLLGTAAFKNSTSVVTDSSDLVESGAVKDIVGWGNKNLLPNDAVSQTINGVTFTVNSDGSVTVNGTATARADFIIKRKPQFTGEKVLSGCPSGGSSSTYRLVYNNRTDGSFSDYGEGVNITKYSDVTYPNNGIEITIYSGYTANNLIFKPMISKDGGEYEPYHASVEESLAEKTDNTVIAPVENGSTASQAYAVGSHAIRNGAFITWKNAKAQSEPIDDASDYTSGDVAGCLIQKEPISGTTDENGNITIYFVEANKHILKCEIGPYIAIPYTTSTGNQKIHVTNAALESITNTAISGVCYYSAY